MTSKLKIRDKAGDITMYEVYKILKEFRKLQSNVPEELVDLHFIDLLLHLQSQANFLLDRLIIKIIM